MMKYDQRNADDGQSAESAGTKLSSGRIIINPTPKETNELGLRNKSTTLSVVALIAVPSSHVITLHLFRSLKKLLFKKIYEKTRATGKQEID